jgi:hypothetical protein
VPVACLATVANVNDTVVFERLFLSAFAVLVRIQAEFADKGYDAGPTARCAAPSESNCPSTRATALTARD